MTAPAPARSAGRAGVDSEPFDLSAALAVVRKRTTLVPKTALVLGSGLGILAEGTAWDRSLPTEEIPGLPRSTVAGHSGIRCPVTVRKRRLA